MQGAGTGDVVRGAYYVRRDEKLQIPNFKFQRNSKLQYFNHRAGGLARAGGGVAIINCVSKVTFGYIHRELVDGG
jgi:hypothetical protein